LSHFSGKNILITGGLGFIGSNLARKLVSLSAQVTIVDSLIPEYGGNLFNISDIEDKIKVNISDIRDEYSLKYHVKGMDYIFNLAGQTSHLDSMQDPFTDLEINSRAQLSILEACRRYNPGVKIIFASTRQIYGKPDYLPVDEKHPTRPVDVNGINKLSGEWYHLLYHSVYGIRTSVLRLTNTYGPGMRIKDSRQIFLGIWIRLLLEEKAFEIWEGDQLRDFTYVDDVVDAFLMVAENHSADGQVYNLGGMSPICLRDLGDLLLKIHGHGKKVLKEFPVDRKKIDIGDFYSDYRKIQRELGWIPKISLLEGLTETYEYYKNYQQYYL